MKGQVSTEFFVYITVFMFVVISAFILVNHLQSTEIPLQHNQMARLAGEEFSNAVTLAVKGGIGFTYNYTFPRAIMGTPYTIDFEPGGSNKIIMEWPGPYGNFSYSYNIPAYEYKYGGCTSGRKLVSNRCDNVITLSNDGENLTITQQG